MYHGDIASADNIRLGLEIEGNKDAEAAVRATEKRAVSRLSFCRQREDSMSDSKKHQDKRLGEGSSVRLPH
jgi:hypothetical protein